MYNQDPTTSSINNAEAPNSATQSNAMYRSRYGEFPKLNDLNYSQWRKHVEVLLRAEDAFELTIGNEKPPADNQRLQLAEYCGSKGKAIDLMFESCTTSAQQYLDGQRDPSEMWTLLAQKLNTVASRAGRMSTLRQFSRARPIPGKPIAEYISTLLYFRD